MYIDDEVFDLGMKLFLENVLEPSLPEILESFQLSSVHSNEMIESDLWWIVNPLLFENRKILLNFIEIRRIRKEKSNLMFRPLTNLSNFFFLMNGFDR